MERGGGGTEGGAKKANLIGQSITAQIKCYNSI